MISERFPIAVEHPHVDEVGALWQAPDGVALRCGLLLGHGAGSSLDGPVLEAVALGLVERGFGVLRFRYPYTERAFREERRFPPDRMPRLEAAHEAACLALRERVGGARVLLGGKSMGGRVSSHLAARGIDCAGLVFLGYPLHRPKRPQKLRDEHFGAIAQPALFLQGTRDPLCDLELLERSLEVWGGVPTVDVIDTADHDFRVLRRTGRTREEVLAELVERIDAWEARTFPD